MKVAPGLLIVILFFIMILPEVYADEKNPGAHITNNKDDLKYPLGNPGLRLTYHHSNMDKLPAAVVRTIQLLVGSVDQKHGLAYQWLQLHAIKENRETFNVWILCSVYPSRSLKTAQENITRYILQAGDSKPVEFIEQKSNSAILPATGAWEFLLPRPDGETEPFMTLAAKVQYLGHEYRLESHEQSTVLNVPAQPHVIKLTPDLLTGVPHNMRQKDETRRYDESDYEMIRLMPDDYAEMIAAGLNCFRVDAQQVKWIERSNVYYWGIGGKDIQYPECLYKSNYIGPALFLDEPMVRTRDHVVRPKLQKDPDFRKTLTPQKVLSEFKNLFHEAKYEHSPTALLSGLAAREDVDIGDMSFLQQNMYTWETMVSSASYQLSEGDEGPPFAIVFEPPGRFGARRVLPELNMCFECQIPVDDPKNLASIIYGFLRGAARISGKEWGVSIYGAVDRSDTFWLLTHAYDLGASLFFYWDSYQLACVPYNEYLAMTKHLQAHARNFPKRNLEKLKKAAEIAILLPPGYNLGHVHMGRGVFWGIPELNLERMNSYGVTYRSVMNNFYTEIERCIRLGVAFDLLWNLEYLNLTDYREVITVREDGKVAVLINGKSKVFGSARTPLRPDGIPPGLSVEILTAGKAGLYEVTARAKVKGESAPIFYTQGADKKGIYNNQYVLWELFGPNQEDYNNLWQETWEVYVIEKDSLAEVEIRFDLVKPGNYRLRAAVSDVAGRSTVKWNDIHIAD
jgi:hypothetical protein